MAQVIVRDLDDGVERKAVMRGHSLEQREILSRAARITTEERVALAISIRDMTPEGVTQTDSAELIRQDRLRSRPRDR